MALDFNGSSHYIDCGTGVALTGAFTIATWLKISTVTTAQRTMGTFHVDSSSVYRGVFLQMGDTGYPYVALGLGAAFSQCYRVAETDIDNDTWWHVATVFDPSTRLDMFLNGAISNGTINGAIPSSFTASSQPFRIQAYNNNGTLFYGRGSLADVRVYNRALSAGEIASIYHARGGDTIINSLLGRWLLLGPDGTSASGAGGVQDISPNGYHGTPYNNPVYLAAPFKCRRD